MLGAILDGLPPKVRPYVVGALALSTAASAVYAVATLAAEKKIEPLATELREHRTEQKIHEEYDAGLKEAIWSDLRALCAATPGAKCDGYVPLPKTR